MAKENFLNDDAFLGMLRKTQGSGPKLRTSSSLRDTTRLDVTTFSVSGYMQGAALHSHTSLAYALGSESAMNGLSTLLTDKNSDAFDAFTLSQLPMNVLAKRIRDEAAAPTDS